MCMMRGILDSVAIEENKKVLNRGSIKAKNATQVINDLGQTTYLDQN